MGSCTQTFSRVRASSTNLDADGSFQHADGVIVTVEFKSKVVRVSESLEAVRVILVAEDDPNDVFFLRRAFQKAEVRCQIMDVPNGEEAINYLQGTSSYSNRTDYPLPHLLLLDV